MHVGLVGTGRIGALHARSLRSRPLVSRLTVMDAKELEKKAVGPEMRQVAQEMAQEINRPGT